MYLQRAHVRRCDTSARPGPENNAADALACLATVTYHDRCTRSYALVVRPGSHINFYAHSSRHVFVRWSVQCIVATAQTPDDVTASGTCLQLRLPC